MTRISGICDEGTNIPRNVWCRSNDVKAQELSELLTVVAFCGPTCSGCLSDGGTRVTHEILRELSTIVYLNINTTVPIS